MEPHHGFAAVRANSFPVGLPSAKDVLSVGICLPGDHAELLDALSLGESRLKPLQNGQGNKQNRQLSGAGVTAYTIGSRA